MNEELFGAWEEPEVTPEPVTIDQVDHLVKRYQSLRQQKEKAEEDLKEINGYIQACERQLVQYLTDCRKSSWKVEGLGQVQIRNYLTVKTPKDPDQKKAFFDYLKSKGIFEDLVSVNHQTLNAFYKTEREQAEGDANFAIPGLDAPTLQQGIAFKKG
jgi:hypothetical protein